MDFARETHRLAKEKSMKNRLKPNEPGIALGVALIALLSGLLTASFMNPMTPGPMRAGVPTIILCTYILTLGATFLAAYYFEHKSFFFRLLIRISEGSKPKGRMRLLFGAGLAFLIGRASCRERV